MTSWQVLTKSEKEIITTTLYKLSQSLYIEKMGEILNSFNDASVTLMLKWSEDVIRKEQANIHLEQRQKSL